jgi:NADH-quinone oxidoreductase subunit A
VDPSVELVLPIFLFLACSIGLAAGLLILANLFNPNRPRGIPPAPYESGMDPIHDTHRRFDVRFYLLAIAFLVFDVELLFLYPWAVAWNPGGRQEVTKKEKNVGEVGERGRQGDKEAKRQIINEKTAGGHDGLPTSPRPFASSGRDLMFPGAMVFLALLTVGYVYDWRKGVFQWR